MPKYYCKKCQFRTVRKEKLNNHMNDYHLNDNNIIKYFNLKNFLKSKIIVDINKIISSFHVPIEGSCLYENNTSFKFRINIDADILRNNLYKLAEISNNILDLKKSFVVGDRWRDIDAGFKANCKTILIDNNYKEKINKKPDFIVKKFKQILKHIIK